VWKGLSWLLEEVAEVAEEVDWELVELVLMSCGFVDILNVISLFFYVTSLSTIYILRWDFL